MYRPSRRILFRESSGRGRASASNPKLRSMAIIFEAAEKAKPQLDQLDCVMMGLLAGSNLAAHLAGVRIFTDLYKNKEFAHEVCSFAGNVGALSASFTRKWGARLSRLSIRSLHRLSRRYSRICNAQCPGAIREIHDRGLTSCFFICGDCTKVIEEVCTIGTHAFAVDEQLNMNFVRIWLENTMWDLAGILNSPWH